MKYLLLALVLSLGGNGWLIFHAGGEKPKCELKLTQQVAQQNTATATDQGKADQQQIQELQGKLAARDKDATSDMGTIAALNTRFHAQAQVLHDLQAQQTDICLRTRVPQPLLDSLRLGAAAAAQPPG